MDLFLLLILALTVKGDSDESKYVDLLPEEEKEEFIQSVARRIIENVETKEVANKSSVEIPDEELKEHEALVKKIIKEESSNIRRHREQKERLEAEDDVSVKSIENLKEMQRAGSIDLTIRSDRKKRRDAEIPVEVITEMVVINTMNFGREIKTGEEANTGYAQSSKEDIEVRHIETPVTETIDTITENIETTTEHTETINFIAVNGNTTEVVNETVPNIAVKYADSSKEDALIKHIKRRAIENITIPETIDNDDIKANNSNVNDTVNLEPENEYENENETEFLSVSKEHKHTIMDNFDPSGEETTEFETTDNNDTNDTSTIIPETTTVQETTVNVTTEGKSNETIEEQQVTHAIYDSETESDGDSDGGCSDESANNETIASSNTSVVEETTPVKSYLRSNDYDAVTYAAVVLDSGNSIDTIRIETVADKNIDKVIQSSTTDKGSTDKTTEIPATKSANNNSDIKPLEITTPRIIVDDNNKADKIIALSETGDSDTVPSNTHKSTVTSDVTTIVPDVTTVKNISDISKEVTVTTTTLPCLQNNEATGVKAVNTIPQTRFAIVIRTNTDPVKNVGPNKDLTITSGDTADNNESKDTILTTTESVVTTMYINKPTKTMSYIVKNQATRTKIDATMKIPVTTTKFKHTNPPVKILYDKPIHILRDSGNLVKDEKKEADVFKDLQKAFYTQSQNNKEYQVYEIPADKPPFVRDSIAITEQPYYVPVYNYSPNKAYFNAQNRLGPNADDVNDVNIMETAFDTDEEDEKQPADNAQKSDEDFGTFKDSPNYYNDYFADDDQRKKFGNQEVHSKLDTRMRKIVKKGCSNSPDVDLGCANKVVDAGSKVVNDDKIFPDTDDELHPYTSMKEGNLKDHVSAVRNVLNQMMLFSYPEVNKPTEESIETTTEPELEEVTSRYFRNNDKSSGIALDYYFGRMKPEHESRERNYYKKVGYFKNFDKTKNLYMNKEFFNDNLIKYINLIKYKGNTYIDSDSATPHTDLLDEVLPNLTQQAELLQDKIKIISMTDQKDVYNTLEKTQEFNATLKKENDNFNVYITVLKDMIHVDNNALKQYDWLGTTVDLQSAMDKLLGLIKGVQSIEEIHPSDLELLKYVVFLHKFSYDLVENKLFVDKLRKLYPPSNNLKKQNMNEGLLHRAWLYLRKKRTNQEDNNLENLNEFLIELQEGLYDLHEAIKNIAEITTFKKQNWFKNIKDLYLTDDKSYLTLLLHISATRLIMLIEDSSRSNLEDDFRSYVRKNRRDTMKTVDEMLFVLRILAHMKIYE